MMQRPLFRVFAAVCLVHAMSPSPVSAQEDSARVRARELGVAPGIFATGRHNAITDVGGVRVGQVTLKEGDRIRTGITAILNDIRARPVTADSVRRALASAQGGPVQEGSVGAGTGTVAFGWKGGIGTSSRVLPQKLGGWTIGVLVQSNFGGVLQVSGAPIGRELERYAFRDAVVADDSVRHDARDRGDGSIMIVIATDAPLGDRNLRRLASRGMMGLGRTGSSASNGSGDYVIAFSTAESVRRPLGAERVQTTELANDQMSAVFQAGVDAVEEAIYNSLFMATTTQGNGETVEALPLERVSEILRRHGIAPPTR